MEFFITLGIAYTIFYSFTSEEITRQRIIKYLCSFSLVAFVVCIVTIVGK